jgi:integral membrane protein (TIGR01906 family)
VFVTPAFVHHEYGTRNFPASDRFDQTERVRLSDAALHYLRGRISRAELAELRTDSGDIAFRASEVDHLEDVKQVMDGMFLAHAIAIGLAVLAAIVVWCSPLRHRLPMYLRHGLWVIGGLIVLVLGASLIDFGVFFTRFHQIFFEEGTWVFSYSDTLIQLYPLPLWVDAVWKYGALVLLEAGLLYTLTAVIRIPRPVVEDAA